MRERTGAGVEYRQRREGELLGRGTVEHDQLRSDALGSVVQDAVREPLRRGLPAARALPVLKNRLPARKVPVRQERTHLAGEDGDPLGAPGAELTLEILGPGHKMAGAVLAGARQLRSPALAVRLAVRHAPAASHTVKHAAAARHIAIRVVVIHVGANHTRGHLLDRQTWMGS